MTLPPDDLSDDAIGRLIRQKDERGLIALLARHGGRVKAYMRGRFGNLLRDEDIEDALNEGAYRVWKRFDPERGSSLGPFLLWMTYHAIVDLLRGNTNGRDEVSTGPTTLALEAVSRESELDGAEHQELRLALVEAMQKLTSLERAIIEADLESGGKASTTKLSEILGSPPSSISHSRRRAYVKLRKRLANFVPWF